MVGECPVGLGDRTGTSHVHVTSVIRVTPARQSTFVTNDHLASTEWHNLPNSYLSHLLSKICEGSLSTPRVGQLRLLPRT